jgi:hypothetical protein
MILQEESKSAGEAVFRDSQVFGGRRLVGTGRLVRDKVNPLFGSIF